MVLLTYQLPDAIRDIAMKGEFNEFDLNVFFSSEGLGDQAKFKYEDARWQVVNYDGWIHICVLSRAAGSALKNKDCDG